MKIRDMFNIFFLKFNFVFCFSFITLSCVSGMSTKVCLFVWLVDLATECYEHACGKFPNKMELMMGLFNCYVREYSFVKQQQVCCFLLSRGLIFCLFNLSHFFFLYVCHFLFSDLQTAIKMYKLAGEEKYLLWSVCSIHLQVLPTCFPPLSYSVCVEVFVFGNLSQLERGWIWIERKMSSYSG